MDLHNRRGVVTGAGSGIGRVLAVELGRRGADLLLVGRRPGPLEETAAMIRAAGGHARVLPLDITAGWAPQQVIETAVEHGALELLVNNAGNVRAGELEDIPKMMCRR
ncbi:SDR family NAD(P)-dependent oxidoreductase [Pseudarthrobacter sp. CC12]|uniref:SDR family NAD(P)-dependent oxidoreductase n=1 Tax=Pseudarthrobacter sp. CC12 TaxID=3029193 RepID=UPI0032636276